MIVLDGGDVVFQTTFALYRTPIDQASQVPFSLDSWGPLLCSSDGTRVVFVRHPIVGDDELYSLSADGSTREVLLSPNVDSSADFLVSEARNRVVYRDRFELFGVPIDGRSPPVKLNPTLDPLEKVESFRLFSEGKRVVYLADQDVDDQLELFGVPSDGSLAPVQLNDPLPPGGDVTAYSIGARRVVYLADQEEDERFELYSAPILRRKIVAGAIKVSGPLVPGGDVQPDFQLTPDRLRVVYRADQDTDEVFELYASFLHAPAERLRDLNGLAPRVR